MRRALKSDPPLDDDDQREPAIDDPVQTGPFPLPLLFESVPASLGLGLRTASEANGESVVKIITDYHLLSWVQRIVKLRKANSPLHLREASLLQHGRGRTTYLGRRFTGGRGSPKYARKSWLFAGE